MGEKEGGKVRGKVRIYLREEVRMDRENVRGYVRESGWKVRG